MFKRKIQVGYKLAIPKDLYENNQLQVGQKVEILVVDKGTTLSESGLFIRFLDESRG